MSRLSGSHGEPGGCLDGQGQQQDGDHCKQHPADQQGARLPRMLCCLFAVLGPCGLCLPTMSRRGGGEHAGCHTSWPHARLTSRISSELRVPRLHCEHLTVKAAAFQRAPLASGFCSMQQCCKWLWLVCVCVRVCLRRCCLTSL